MNYPALKAKLDPQLNHKTPRRGENPGKNACRTRLRYLRYAPAENSKCFSRSFPRPGAYQNLRVKFSLKLPCDAGSWVSLSQNSVSFGKGFGKSALKAAFSSKSKVAFPKTEVLGKPRVSDFSLKNLSLDRKLSILCGFIPRNLGIGKKFALKAELDPQMNHRIPRRGENPGENNRAALISVKLMKNLGASPKQACLPVSSLDRKFIVQAGAIPRSGGPLVRDRFTTFSVAVNLTEASLGVWPPPSNQPCPNCLRHTMTNRVIEQVY